MVPIAVETSFSNPLYPCLYAFPASHRKSLPYHHFLPHRYTVDTRRSTTIAVDPFRRPAVIDGPTPLLQPPPFPPLP
eukprot:scaffold2452_cov194-Amphora_coffeaeformis.AAC.6